MKKTFTKIMLLLFALVVGSSNVWAQEKTETPVYSLTFSQMSSGTNYNSYTASHSVTASSKEWTVYGNQSVGNLLRVGGKTTTATDRTLTSNATLVNKKIYKVILSHNGITNGSNTTMTVNSIKVEGSTSSSFPNESTITKVLSSPSVSSSGTLTFEPDDAWAANSYFRITVNYHVVTTKSANNCGINITSVDFYEELTPSISADDVNIAADILSGNISYNITNPNGSTLTATKKSGDWLTVGAVDAVNKKVAFTAEENTTASSRPAVVTLTYGTATKDVTITQAAATEKFTVTFSAPSNGTLVIKRDETTLSSGDEVPSGTTLTVLATPADGYILVKWEYSTNGGSTWSDGDGTSYTVTSAVQFRASFVAKVYHTITYSVNGTETEVDVEEGEAISFAAPASGIPSGYTFMGWSESSIATYQANETGITYVSSGDSSKDITYYAVMAIETITSTTVTLNASGMSTAAYGSGTRDDDKGNTWSYYAAINNDSGTFNFGLNSNANNYNIGSPSFSGNITAITMKVKNGSSKDDRTVYICSSNSTAQPSSGDIASLSVPKSSSFDTNRSINLSSSPTFSQFYVYVSAALAFSEIKVTYDKPSYSGYCSTINTFTNNDGNNWNTNGNWSWGAVPTTEPAVTISAACTIPDDYTANVDNIIITGDGSLTIANGGQLITANSVAATVEKTITKPDSWSNNDNTGWYAISSPVDNIAPGSVTNMTPDPANNVPQYDLYKYVENMGWYNSQYSGQSISSLEKGHGYLYARSTNATLSFDGSVVSNDFELTGLSKSDVKHSGLHLIGNPYTHTIYYGVAIDGDISNAGYYKLNSTGSWISTAAGTAIDPMEAVFVFVTKDNATVSFSNDASAPASKANQDYIQFTVANSQYEDVAYAMFDKGNGLNKIEHRNSEAPMIYIPQNDDNYAIAMMNDNTPMFGLNFKAATTGKYTLSYNTKGDYSYLHLIDRLTGEDIDMLIDNEYSFIGSPIDGDNRFIVKLTYNSGNEVLNNDIFAYQSGSDIIVNGEGELQVFDVTGRRVMTTTINGVETINVPSQGVYIFRLNEKVQKIVVR
ncbi:MAG: InlB B-repeat-containing protein [Bacteroidales bacterium]|nr:InlB B-repeat-containing protein [Bacteroidales bacterium]